MGNCKSSKSLDNSPLLGESVSQSILSRSIEEDSSISLDYSRRSFATNEAYSTTKYYTSDDDMSLKPHWSLMTSGNTCDGNTLSDDQLRMIVTRTTDNYGIPEDFQHFSSGHQENNYTLSKGCDNKTCYLSHPLHCAIERGDPESSIYRWLESDPDSIYIRNNNGKVALDIAKELKHDNKENIVKLILKFESKYKMHEFQNEALSLGEDMSITGMSLRSICSIQEDEQKVSSPRRSHAERAEAYDSYSGFNREKCFRSNRQIERSNEFDSQSFNEFDVLRYENERLKAEVSELKNALSILTSSLTGLQAKQEHLIENILIMQGNRENLCSI